MVELAPHEPVPVEILRTDGKSPFFLVCDHASKRIPEALGTLGLPDREIERHIGWDIGAAEVARRLSEIFDATLVLQNYSRLVIDCNRRPDVESSIPELSEETVVPGNEKLPAAAAAQRAQTIFRPYHERISDLLDRRAANGRRSVLVALHSFTPVFKGVSRPWPIGIQYNRAPGLSRCLIAELSLDAKLVVGDNEPYAVSDETDYTIPVHGEGRDLAHVLIEIRHDLIGDRSGQKAWAERLGRCLTSALKRYDDQI